MVDIPSMHFLPFVGGGGERYDLAVRQVLVEFTEA
jgi:hypothetical protein